MFPAFGARMSMVSPQEALPGRGAPPPGIPERHAVLDTPLRGPYPQGTEVLYVGMGCFWGAERIFWRLDGVVTTAAGYAGGYTPNPTYEEVCTGRTGHTEAVLIAYDPRRTGPGLLLKAFWENHDPTTPNRQGNDVGTQYRSAIYWATPGQEAAAETTRAAFAEELRRHGYGAVTTEIRPFHPTRTDPGAGPFYFAEDYHQQYLHANPGGYCNHGPNGLTCQIGLVTPGSDELPAQIEVQRPG